MIHMRVYVILEYKQNSSLQNGYLIFDIRMLNPKTVCGV